MATLYLNNLPIKICLTNALFYGQYQYSASIDLAESWVFRYSIEHEHIDTKLNKQQAWRETVKDRWPLNSFVRQHDPITAEIRQQLHQVADFIRSAQQNFKLVVNNHAVRFYTNDPALLQAIDQLPGLAKKHYSLAQVNRPANSILLHNPQHQYRSYLRESRITEEEKAQIRNFLTGRADIRIGPGLARWLEFKNTSFVSRYTRNYFFVDYDHPNWPTMFALVRPGLIRKTVNILAK